MSVGDDHQNLPFPDFELKEEGVERGANPSLLQDPTQDNKGDPTVSTTSSFHTEALPSHLEQEIYHLGEGEHLGSEGEGTGGHLQHDEEERPARASPQEGQTEEEEGRGQEAEQRAQPDASTSGREEQGPSREQKGKGVATGEFAEEAGAGSPASGHGVAEGQGEFEEEGSQYGGGGAHRQAKKPRLVWTAELHSRFMNAVNHLGVKNAVPKTILQLMNVEGMTRENVASHLQKYRLYLKRMSGIPASSRLPPDLLQGSGHMFPYVHHPYELPPAMVQPQPIAPQPQAHIPQPFHGIPMQRTEVSGASALLSASPPGSAMGLPSSHLGEGAGPHSPYRGTGGASIGPGYPLPGPSAAPLPIGQGFTPQLFPYGQPAGPMRPHSPWEHLSGPGGSGQGPGGQGAGLLQFRGLPGQPGAGYMLGGTPMLGAPPMGAGLGMPPIGSPPQGHGGLYPHQGQSAQGSVAPSEEQQQNPEQQQLQWSGEPGQQWSGDVGGSDWKRWPEQGGDTPPRRW